MIFLVLFVVPITLAKQRTLYEWTVEHAWTCNNSAVYKHLNHCTGVQHLFDIASLHLSLLHHQHLFKTDKFDFRAACINLVQDNTEIIDRHRNWNILLFKEALKIKELNPILNSGLKASKELQLFESMVPLHTLNCLNIQLITSFTQS